MFEKDAEEHRKHFENELYLFDNTDIFPSNIEEAFQKGAEFGYNKCFEQIRKIVNEHTRLDCIIPELLRLKESE